MRRRITTWIWRGLLTLAVFIPAAAASLFLGVQVSSQPRFCGTCHYMQPYYESWKTSMHKEVACVECHIPPGVSSEVRKKYEALAMVARYFTGTYSTNPWAEVDDQSCLRGGCHETRLLLGRELYRNILFDHQPHLTELRREKRLRCTSCHSQIVQGSHISVTPTTCFLCHFKGKALNEGTARCTLCHEIPERRIETAGLSFDHGEVKRFDMDCVLCHQGVVKGDGDVPRERCNTCHNDVERLNRYGETEFLHRKHVTDHKVECLNCHIEIVHKVPDREEALATGCRICHSAAAGHSPVRDLYRGIGGEGVTPRPAAMYLAGIRCEACHNVAKGEHVTASEVSCMACHGPKYLTIYRNWQVGLEKRLTGVTEELGETKTKLASKGSDASRNLLAVAEKNLALVKDGLGIHNPRYAVDILAKTHEDLVAARKEAGEAAPASLPWVQAPYKTDCLQCHFGIEYLSKAFAGAEFPHQPHVVAGRIRCTVCHTPMENHGGIKIGAADCKNCHDRIRRKMTVASPEECLVCHVADIGTVSETVKFPHETHVQMGLDCALCHVGVSDKPHREFARSSSARPKLEHSFCGTCHAADVLSEEGTPPEGADCAKCHVGF